MICVMWELVEMYEKWNCDVWVCDVLVNVNVWYWVIEIKWRFVVIVLDYDDLFVGNDIGNCVDILNDVFLFYKIKLLMN